MNEDGRVYLVGAGPGDPGLITVKGLRALRRADVVVYDRLVNPSLLAEARDDAELADVGKHPARQDGRTQDEINRLLIDRAGAGNTVVRLKGGDPFLFGRGGEEASALAAAGIVFEVVPGVTSALAAPAYAGIPVTDRRHASSLRIITGQRGLDGDSTTVSSNETVIALMGVRALPDVVESLRREGWPEEAPAALIEWGTTSRQRTTVATVGAIADRAQRAGVRAPAILICGDVVHLREDIAWYERRPLFGKRIMALRGETRATELIALLDAAGAEPVHIPAVSFGEPDDWSQVDAALERISEFQWLSFTSANGVDYFMKRLLASGLDSRALAGARLAVVGPATASALARVGLRHDAMPDQFNSRALAETLAAASQPGYTVLLPRGDLADDALPDALRGHGLTPWPVIAYQTLPGPDLARRANDALSRGVDAIVLTSPSTARNLVEALDNAAVQVRDAAFISAGPTTTRAAESLGLTIAVEAAAHTANGIIDAALEWAARSS